MFAVVGQVSYSGPMAILEESTPDEISIEDFYINIAGEDYLRLALTTAQAAKVSGMSVRTLEKLRTECRGPAYIQAGPHKKVRYFPKDLLTYLASQRRLSSRLSADLAQVVADET